MKEDLIKLIEGTEQIKTKFHSTGGQGMPAHNIICGRFYPDTYESMEMRPVNG